MPQVARVGDIGVGVCYAHDEPRDFVTVFVEGCSTVFANGQQVCCVGAIGVTSCGHTTMATQGSPAEYGESSQIHRVGDVGIVLEGGHYTCVQGSPDVYAG